MPDPKDFLLNTDYEMDKIVYYKSGELLPTGNTAVYVDTYNLGFIPLTFAVFSFSEDFSDTRMDIMMTYNDDVSIVMNTYADGVTIQYVNNNDQNKKLYYRIYGFEPSNSMASVGKTQKDAKQFILNTDYNYCKLHSKGIADSDTTITHNLGYCPFVLAWQEGKWGSESVISPCWISGAEDIGYPNIITTPNTLVISGLQNNKKVHYRIYYEEI